MPITYLQLGTQPAGERQPEAHRPSQAMGGSVSMLTLSKATAYNTPFRAFATCVSARPLTFSRRASVILELQRVPRDRPSLGLPPRFEDVAELTSSFLCFLTTYIFLSEGDFFHLMD